jgi:hypothetical protein
MYYKYILHSIYTDIISKCHRLRLSSISIWLTGSPQATIRPEHFSGRAGFGPGWKKFCYFGPKKILPMTIPLDVSGLNFRAGPGLGRVTCVFYSVKQLKTTFPIGLGPKKFRGLQDLCPRPSGKIRGRAGPGPGRAGLKMLKCSHNTLDGPTIPVHVHRIYPTRHMKKKATTLWF